RARSWKAEDTRADRAGLSSGSSTLFSICGEEAWYGKDVALLLECCSSLPSWEELQHANEAEEEREKRRCCILLEDTLGMLLDFFPGAWLDPVVCVTQSIRDKEYTATGSA
ncbi:hypothetical protein LEMLEM_LOCUS4759, partial [Lemmus lemmus]